MGFGSVHSRLLELCAAVACMAVLVACGGGGGSEVTPPPPPPPQPISISIAGMPSASMLPGQSAQLTATMTYSDSSVKNVTTTAAWSTTNANVLSVSSSGAIVAIAPGQADVVASSQGLSGRGTVRIALPAPRLTLFAGNLGGPGSADGTGADARFNWPNDVATDRAGNVYVADTNNHTIRKITPAGMVSTLTDTTGTPIPGGDGLTTDSAGNIYATLDHSILKISVEGRVSTLAGEAGQSGSIDGVGADARFNSPDGLATDSVGNIYAADRANYRIRKITPAGLVSTLAGGAYGFVDGAGASAKFNSPYGVATDTSGNVYVADLGNHAIRKITPAGVVSTLAGGAYGYVDGTGPDARFVGPIDVATDSAGNVFVADGNAIRRVTPAGVVSTLAGDWGNSGSADGTGADARFYSPVGVATDSAGNAYVADRYNNTIRKISAAGVVSTLAGSASVVGSTDGVGADARFGGCHPDLMNPPSQICAGPAGVATDGAGNVYVADVWNNTIRKISSAGVVSTLAGSAGASGYVDGTGAEARFVQPLGAATDTAGNVYVADGNRIRKITPASVVSTLAGTSGQSGSTDGIGAQARFYGPQGIATDSAGNVYVADTYNYTIRKITPAGVVNTLAGAAGVNGSADGTGADARFAFPIGVTTDNAGNVYVADTSNHTIRKITPAGVVSTLAGTAGQSGSDNGIGAGVRFYLPTGLATDGAGNLYVADQGNHTIRKITPAGVVSTVVGVAGRIGFAQGALPGGLTAPYGVAISSSALYITTSNGVAIVTNVP